MQERDIRDIIFSGFKRDMCYMIEHSISENKWSYELELFLLTLKSIAIDQDIGGNAVDYSRFDKELKLWENYRHGGDKTVMAVLRGNRSDYWEQDDESLLTRLLSILLVNEDRHISKSEVLKHTLYFTGKQERVLDAVIFNSLLSSIFGGVKDGELLETLKRDVIELSIAEDIVDKGYMMMDLGDYDGDYVVDFERKRIELIMLLSRAESSLDSLIQLLCKGKSNGSDKYREFLSRITGDDNFQYESSFLDGISNYIYRLRKGRLAPKSLEVQVGGDVDIFDLRPGEVVFHPLLNKIELLSISKREGFEVRLVKSRSGIYRFFRR